MVEPSLDPAGTMPLVEHLRELRARLLRCFAAIAVCAIAGYAFADRIFALLMAPLVRVLGTDQNLIYTSPAEAFVVQIKVGIIAGVFAASPVLLYQIWKFVVPGLYPKERSYVLPFVLFASLFFVGGALFGYLVIFPYSFEFFINHFQTDRIRAMISVDNYLRFSAKLLLAFGLTFELPIVVLFLARMGLVTPRFLWRNFRYAVLLLAVAAAVFTPPDAFTMMAMLIPLTALYLLSIGVAHLFQRRSPDSEGATAKPGAGGV